MTGSWVTKPGDRQARPTSWIPRPSLAVKGRAEAGELLLSVFLERSSLRGLGRVLLSVGEPGSFLMTTLGVLASALDLFDLVSVHISA